MRSSRAWECPSTIVRQGARQRNGKEGYETQGDTGPEVRGAAAQPLPAVRQGARLYAYVRYVPLLQSTGQSLLSALRKPSHSI